jgi:ABC-type amino acid transport substrate-binding protein
VSTAASHKLTPSHARHTIRLTRKKSKSTVAATRARDVLPRSSQTNRQIPGKAAAPDANIVDPHSTVEVAKTRTIQEQIATATTAAERMSGPVASPDALVAVLVAGPDIKSISDLAGKTIAIDDRYSASNSSVRIAVAAAGALEVQLSAGQTTAIDQLINKEVPAAVVALVTEGAAESFPHFTGFRTFQIPLLPRSPNR